MIKRMLYALLSITMFINPIQAGIWDSISNYFSPSPIKIDDHLKILVTHNKPGVILEVKGKYQIFDPNTNARLGKGYIGKRKYIQPLSDGLKWGEEFPSIFQIMIMPDDKNTTTLVDGIEYKGNIYVYDIGGSLSIVNDISFDEYAKTVLSTNLEQPLPEEALAALAIAARTNAYYMKKNSKNEFWDVDAKQINYQGYALSYPSNLVDQAVKVTHHMVMNQSSTPFVAKWDIVDAGNTLSGKLLESKISLDQAAMLAHQGEHAAQILKKAFPTTQVDLID